MLEEVPNCAVAGFKVKKTKKKTLKIIVNKNCHQCYTLGANTERKSSGMRKVLGVKMALGDAANPKIKQDEGDGV